MKKLLISALATVVVASFAVSAEAAGNKQKESPAEIRASCNAQAAKKYSPIHFIQGRKFVNNCIAQHAKGSQKRQSSER
jgi:hypothetical protein